MRFLGMLRHGNLAHPFEQRFFFAGGATHAHAYSAAHGAYDSGLRTEPSDALARYARPRQRQTNRGSLRPLISD
jgi:monoamine oxidase